MNAITQPAPIQSGSKWGVPKDGPWGGFEGTVTVRETLNGWVRYDMQVFKDQRMHEADFRRIYKPVDELEENAGARVADDCACSVCGARGYAGKCPTCEAL